jgi:hypothetical protein
MSDPYELVEVVVHSAEYQDPTIPTNNEREQHWRHINTHTTTAAAPSPLACEYCIRGIKDIENGQPIYCQCPAGKKQKQQQITPVLAQIGENIIHFFRNLFSDKN